MFHSLILFFAYWYSFGFWEEVIRQHIHCLFTRLSVYLYDLIPTHPALQSCDCRDEAVQQGDRVGSCVLRNRFCLCHSLGYLASYLTSVAFLNPSVFNFFCPIVRPYVSCVLIFIFRNYVLYNHASWSVLGTVLELKEKSRYSLWW